MKIKKVKRLSAKQESLMSEEEYTQYLKTLREKDEKSWIGMMSFKHRMRWHSFLGILMKVTRYFMGIKVHKQNVDTSLIMCQSRPIIFVLTHVGKEDILVFNEVIGCHYTILSGDYESLHNRVEGLIHMLNGTIFFNMASKEERNQIENKVVDILKSGDNILCSMEAAWNLSPNEIVQELFPGMIRAAIKAEAVIFCVGIERFSSKLYGINIAKKVFDPTIYKAQYNCEASMLNIAREELRQYMAELKFELYFHVKIQKRITISREDLGDYDEYESKFKQDILKGWIFTEETIEKKKYINRDKPQYAYEYVLDKYSTLLSGTFEIRKYVELLCDAKDPIYPSRIHRELLKMVEQVICDEQ